MDATIVIGEGEMDEAPMLYIGEKVGTKKGSEIRYCFRSIRRNKLYSKKSYLDAFSVLAVAEKGNLLSAPDTYMEKIVIGSNLPENLLDLDNSVETNINLLCKS